MRGSKEKDITQKALEMYNDVFADIINVLLFNGESVVTEDSLTDVLQESTWLPSFLSKPSTLGIQEHTVLKEIVDFGFC